MATTTESQVRPEVKVLQSYLDGKWQAGSGEGVSLVNPATGGLLEKIKTPSASSGLAQPAGSLGLRVTGGIADNTFDFSGKILCRAGNSILVHRGYSFSS